MVERKTKKKETPHAFPRLAAEQVVPRLVAQLKENVSFRGLTHALDAGEIVCKTLYGGETKHIAHGYRLGPIYTRLAQADGLPYSAVTLRRFLGVYELYHRIGGARLRHVGLSHYIAVVCMPRHLQKKALQTASEQHWPATKLETMVKRWRRQRRPSRQRRTRRS